MNVERDGTTIWKELLEGNSRFAAGNLLRPNQTVARREATAHIQNPRAAVLSCSDSRVIPEMLFDQGIGDLFVVRTPGTILDRGPILGGIEFAVRVLKVPLVVVLGHQRCGAIHLTIESVQQGKTLPGYLEYVAELIRPIAQKIRDMPGDPLELAVRINVMEQMRLIRETEPMASLVTQGHLVVVGGYYDHQTGEVKPIEPATSA